MDVTEPNTPEAQTPPREPRPRRFVPWLLVSLVVLFVLVVPAIFSASPKACGSCHAMKPYYEAYSRDRHRASASSCLDCHARPGTLNRMAQSLMVYRCAVSTVAGRQLPVLGSSPVSCASCKQVGCHSMNRLESLSGKIKINHRLHAEEDIGCTHCHLGPSHDGVGTLATIPKEEQCAECHADRMQDCTYCHTDTSTPVSR